MNTQTDSIRVQTTLNALLAAHERALLPRLTESTVFVNTRSAAELDAVRRMAGEHAADAVRLADVLIGLGTEPVAAPGDIHSTDFHYVNLDVLLPRVLADQERLAARFSAAAEPLREPQPAAPVVAELAARHRSRAEFLRRMTQFRAA